jgi:ATP-binding protein involved in chromosome partitioning
MNSQLHEQVSRILASQPDPVSRQTLVDVVDLTEVSISGDTLNLGLLFGYPINGVKEQLRAELAPLFTNLGAAKVNLKLEWKVKPALSKLLEGAGKVRNILAVASGKGGVGKSTTAANLALALAADGARVGILDADIYGPSVPTLLGVPEGTKPEVHQQSFFLPIEALGLQSMSMGYLADEKTPMVWRGPMASGALQQLLKQTIWADLDYLVVDMPPGTGDIQLTLAQQVPVSGAVIVTTPQDIALLDAKKGVEMFRKVNVPVLGIVENMAIHICSNCGHQEHIFGAGGGEKMAKQYGVSVLGSLPLALSIREQADGGKPTVAADPDGEIAGIYRRVARLAAGQLARMARQAGTAFPKISIHND